MENTVYISKTIAEYPALTCPPGDDFLRQALERAWSAMGLDAENPFKAWLSTGSTALIKPNWVMDVNPKGGGIDCLVSHTTLIKHTLSWLAQAMGGNGTVVIGDCPIQECNFEVLVRNNSIKEMIQLVKQQFPDLEVVVEDWRLTKTQTQASRSSFKFATQVQTGSQGESLDRDYVLVNLGRESFLEDTADFSDLYRVANYNPNLMKEHHCPGKHEYLLTRRAFDADLVINLAKMKTHKKAGLTGALKNLVGLNGHKEFLPHHIVGPYGGGGDCYCSPNTFMGWRDRLIDHYWSNQGNFPISKRKGYLILIGLLRRLAKITGGDGISSGSWSGNETVWRMTLDLNHEFYFGERSPKKVISIVDGIIAGEGEGPLWPTPKPLGMVIVGENPVCIDAAIASIMGYNISRIPTVHNAIYDRRSKFGIRGLNDILIRFLDDKGTDRQLSLSEVPVHSFIKPRHWRRAQRYAYTNNQALQSLRFIESQ